MRITLSIIGSSTGDIGDRLKGVAASLNRLASGEDKQLPRYQSAREEVAVDYAALQRCKRDLLVAIAAIRPLVEK